MNVIVSLVAVLVLVFVAMVGAQAGLTFLFGVVLPYFALALFLVGVIVRVTTWAKSPVPFRIPTTCGQQKTLPWIKSSNFENPHNTFGVIVRMLLEVLFFRSLFRNTKTAIKGSKVVHASNYWLWIFGMAFHYSFLLIFLRHFRFFAEPVPAFVLALQNLDGFLQVGTPMFYITSFLLVGAVGCLFLRRIGSPQLRYISLANDYFPLFMILGIGITGIILRHWVKTDIVSVKELAMGIISFSPITPPDNIHYFFYIHFFLVTVLFAYFPWSKMMHAAGVFLSPTRNLANNNREVRHINPWNPDVGYHTYEAYEDEFRDKMIGAGLPVEKKE
jgi:nitrate reductase gamma subunit